MFPQLRRRTEGGRAVLVVCLLGAAAWVLSAGGAERPLSRITSRAGVLNPTGYPQLVSVDQFFVINIVGRHIIFFIVDHDHFTIIR